MATIDIRIQRIDQLFDSLDPSTFHENEKALRRDADNYIVDFASEYGRADQSTDALQLLPHGLYKLLLRELGVCRVEVLAPAALDKEKLANASLVIEACDECTPAAPEHRPGARKPVCMNRGRDL